MYEVKRAKPSGVSQGNPSLICVKMELRRPSILTANKNGCLNRMDIMPSGNRHWLEYDFVAVVVLFVSIGFLALIVLSI